MARWKLKSAHYLNVPGTEWEQKETDQATGRQGRKVFQVPRLLNPEDGGDCNYPGEIIVCYENKGDPRDIVFIGPPTPEMEPIDAEAKAISKDEEPKWKLPPEMINGEVNYSQSLITNFEKQMAEVANKQNQAVPRSEIDLLKKQVEDLQKLLKAKAA